MKFTLYHSCITVLDLDKSMKFYEEAFGFKEVRRISSDDGSYEIVFMAKEGDETMLELTWYRDRTEPYDLGDNEIHRNIQRACGKETGVLGFKGSHQENGVHTFRKKTVIIPAAHAQAGACTVKRNPRADDQVDLLRPDDSG